MCVCITVRLVSLLYRFGLSAITKDEVLNLNYVKKTNTTTLKQIFSSKYRVPLGTIVAR
jgi:hypothetical protein